MTISMIATHLKTGESHETPVCTNDAYNTFWKRGIEELDLEMLSALGGLWVTRTHIDQFRNELSSLRNWAAARVHEDAYFHEMILRIDAIVRAISLRPPEDYEISFG